MTLYLNDEDVQALLPVDDAFECVSKAFHLLSEGQATNVPRQRTGAGSSVLNVMWALAPSEGTMGVKSYPIVRTDVTQGTVLTLVVYSFSSGELLGIVKADRLGQLRTGAASAVATKSLARPDSKIMAIYGTGFQAETQVSALTRVLPELQTVLVVGRNRQRRDAFIHRLRNTINVDVQASEPEPAARSADVISTATGSAEPVIFGRWLKPGTHVNAVGSNNSTKREIDRSVLERAALIVADDCAVALIDGGDFIANDWDQGGVISMGEVLTSRTPARRYQDDITLFESHGLALQDVVCASLVLRRAQERGEGTKFA
jgi:ornithine cyclodeaminase/alanine dehydrogenase